MSFAAYVPPGSKNQQLRDTPEEIDQALSKRFAGDEGLARVAQLYAMGQIAEAAKKAAAIEKKAEGDKKETARRMREALKRIQTLHERIRNEISNDTNEAWGKLGDLQRAEDEILPADVKSYVRVELERELGDAFANAGKSLFDRERFDEAFFRWESGYKLDPSNPKLLGGFKMLEERAKKLEAEAEGLAQRGDRKACEKWGEIQKITRNGSETKNRAIERSKAGCARGNN
jgi:tetratricopeptide (TPR) repeat protein